MGARIWLPEGRIETTVDPGVVAVSDEALRRSTVRVLALNPHSPLYPSVVDRVTWKPGAQPAALLKPGHYVVETFAAGPLPRRAGSSTFRYLRVTPGEAAWVSEAHALTQLGAVESLRELGLDDAAVALAMGDLDAARVQWLRWRDGP